MAQSFSTPAAAETAFYQAFVNNDLDGMMAVWADSDDIACVHPLGRRLTGRTAVRESWQSLFKSSPKLTFRVGDIQAIDTPELSLHVVHELIRVDDEQDFQPPVVATNVFRFIDGGWRLVLHHASPTRSSKPTKPANPATLH